MGKNAFSEHCMPTSLQVALFLLLVMMTEHELFKLWSASTLTSGSTEKFFRSLRIVACTLLAYNMLVLKLHLRRKALPAKDHVISRLNR